LKIAHHFGRQLVERRRGGIILVGPMGAENGLPFVANDGGAKAYVHSLGEALHFELKALGVYVTVLSPGPTKTDSPVAAIIGNDPKTMLMSPTQCVAEGLNALAKTAPGSFLVG